MKIIGSLLISIFMTTTCLAQTISGAGATFPYPVYAKWSDAYKNQTGVSINYQSIGSGAGIKQIKAQTVVFGASDMPLSALKVYNNARQKDSVRYHSLVG